MLINSGCKGFSTAALLQAGYTIISNVSFKGGLYMQIPPPPPPQYDFCEEFGLKFNFSHLSVDVKQCLILMI